VNTDSEQFRKIYDDSDQRLFGDIEDGLVDANVLLSYLVNNPDILKLAVKIEKHTRALDLLKTHTRALDLLKTAG